MIGYFKMTVAPYDFMRRGLELRIDVDFNGKAYGYIERLTEPSFKSYYRQIIDRATAELEATILKEMTQ